MLIFYISLNDCGTSVSEEYTVVLDWW